MIPHPRTTSMLLALALFAACDNQPTSNGSTQSGETPTPNAAQNGYEPNNTPDSATILVPNGPVQTHTVNGNIFGKDYDEDYISFKTRPGWMYTLRIVAVDEINYSFLRDGKEFSQKDRSPSAGDTCKTVLSSDSVATAVLNVWGDMSRFGLNSTYKVWLTADSVGIDPYEPNDKPDRAFVARNPVGTFHAIAGGEFDLDYFKIPVERDSAYAVRLRGGTGLIGSMGATLDFAKARSNSPFLGQNDSLAFTAWQDDTISLEIRSGSSNYGRYDLLVERRTPSSLVADDAYEPSDLLHPATGIADGRAYHFAMYSEKADEDAFEFVRHPKSSYLVQITSAKYPITNSRYSVILPGRDTIEPNDRYAERVTLVTPSDSTSATMIVWMPPRRPGNGNQDIEGDLRVTEYPPDPFEDLDAAGVGAELPTDSTPVARSVAGYDPDYFHAKLKAGKEYTLSVRTDIQVSVHAGAFGSMWIMSTMVDWDNEIKFTPEVDQDIKIEVGADHPSPLEAIGGYEVHLKEN